MPRTIRNPLTLLLLTSTTLATANALLPDLRDQDFSANAANNAVNDALNSAANAIPTPPSFSVSLFPNTIPAATNWPYVQTDSQGMNTYSATRGQGQGMVGSMTSAVGSFFAQTTNAGNPAHSLDGNEGGEEPSTGILTMTAPMSMSMPGAAMASATATADGMNGNAQSTMPVQTENGGPGAGAGMGMGMKGVGLGVAGAAVVVGGLLV